MHDAASVVPYQRVALAPSMFPLNRSVGHRFKQYLQQLFTTRGGNIQDS